MADVVYPSSYNTYVPDHNATNQMVIDYARNINKFAVNKYTQVIPVKKQTGFYLEMTVEEAGRILQTDLRNVLWPDGSPAPEGNDGTESFIFQEYRTDRRAWPVLLGDLTIDQASWNILAQHSSIKARQAMTARTQLAVTALTTATNYDASHRLAITSITGNTGRWDQSTTARQDIKRSLNEGADVIKVQVDPDDEFVESNEDDNINAPLPFTIGKKSEGGWLENTWLAAGIAGLIFAVLVVILVMTSNIRRRASAYGKSRYRGR